VVYFNMGSHAYCPVIRLSGLTATMKNPRILSIRDSKRAPSEYRIKHLRLVRHARKIVVFSNNCSDKNFHEELTKPYLIVFSPYVREVIPYGERAYTSIGVREEKRELLHQERAHLYKTFDMTH
jgi:hypothetical protein